MFTNRHFFILSCLDKSKIKFNIFVSSFFIDFFPKDFLKIGSIISAPLLLKIQLLLSSLCTIRGIIPTASCFSYKTKDKFNESLSEK